MAAQVACAVCLCGNVGLPVVPTRAPDTRPPHTRAPSPTHDTAVLPPQPVSMMLPIPTHPNPVSRTYQYKKVTKPLLERKRRARINRCLDELKDLMMGALEADGENVNKLEKADILELTVKHLHRITRPRDAAEDVHRFQAGFSQCASEACGFLLSLPGLDERVGRRLVAHLGQCLAAPLSVHVPPRPRSYSPPLDLPPTRPQSSASSPGLSTSPCIQDLSRPLDGLLMTVHSPGSSQDDDLWRPW